MKQGIIYLLSYTDVGGGAHEGLNEGGKQPTVMPLWANVGIRAYSNLIVPNKSNVIILINDNKWDLLK
jgi:hypothetical protein